MNLLDIYMSNFDQFKKYHELYIQRMFIKKETFYRIHLKDKQKYLKQIERGIRTESFIYTEDLSIAHNLKFAVREYKGILKNFGAINIKGFYTRCFFRNKEDCEKASEYLLAIAYIRLLNTNL